MLFIHSFLNGLALVYFETTANTLFLMNYNISELPYIYILTALVSVAIGSFYTKLEKILNIQKLLLLTLLFAISVVAIFFLLIKIFELKMFYMWIMIFKDVMWVFVGIEFGILLGLMFNIRQGKRLFGLVMSGEILAGIIGGFSVGFLLNVIDTVNLLVISFFALLLSLVLLFKILNLFADKFQDSNGANESLNDEVSYLSLFKNNYYFLFFIVSVLAFFIFYFIDYVFYLKVEEHYTNEKELASFFGMFFAMLNSVNLFSSLFLSGIVLSRFGVVFGLLAIPLMALVGTSSLLILASASIAFMLLVIIKLLNEVFDTSVLTPTFRILYQAIPLGKRIKVLYFRETIIEPIAMGLVGLLLLLFATLQSTQIVYYIIIIISIAWIYYARLLRNQYIKSLERMVDKRVFYTDDILFQGVNVNILLKGLSSDNEIQILYYLNLLDKFNYAELHTVLATLLEHKSPRVRKSILEKIQNLDGKEFLDTLAYRMEEETNEEVFATLLLTYCKLGGVAVREKVSHYLYNKNSLVRVSALSGLYKYCGSEGIERAKNILSELFDSTNVSNQTIALLVLGHIGINDFDNHFSNSLKSENFDIRKLSIETVAKLKLVECVPLLFENLKYYEYRKISTSALEEFGESILLQLQDVFKSTNDLNYRLSIVDILGHMHHDKANLFLLECIYEPLLMDGVLEALRKGGYVAKEHVIIHDLLKYNVKNILFGIKVLNEFDEKKYTNTYLVFKELIDAKINNIFLILGFMYSAKTLSQIKLFNSSSVDVKSYAIELLDNLLSQELKKIVLPLLDDIGIEQKLSKYSGEFLCDEYNEEKFFTQLMDDKNVVNILKISLIYEIGKNQEKRYVSLVKNALNSKVNLLCETAQWALTHLSQKE